MNMQVALYKLTAEVMSSIDRYVPEDAEFMSNRNRTECMQLCEHFSEIRRILQSIKEDKK